MKRAATALAGELAPEADVFGLEAIDGALDSVDEAVECVQQTIQALLTLPFLGGSKLVWLKNASFLADNVVGRSESVIEALQRLCEVLGSGLPHGVNFLLSAPLADKRRAAFKSLSKLASTQVHDLPDVGYRGGEEAIIEWTAARVHERNLQLDPDAVEILAARVGLGTAQLESELEKLETAFGTARQVTAEEVRLLVPQTREGGIFDLSRAIEKRNLPLALETLDQLFHQRESAIGILLAAIVPTVRNLLLAKDLLTRHRLPPPAQPHFAGRHTQAPACRSYLPPPEKKRRLVKSLCSRNRSHPRDAFFAGRAEGGIRRLRQRKPAALERISHRQSHPRATSHRVAVEKNVINQLTSQDIVVNSQKRIKAPQCVALSAVPFKIR